MLPPANPLDDLLKTLADEVIPPPSAQRRANTLLKANLAFREKMQAKPQGVGFFKRLLGIGPHTLESRMKMRTLMGGTALALVGVLAVSLGHTYIERSATSEVTFASLTTMGEARQPAAPVASQVANQIAETESTVDQARKDLRAESTSLATPAPAPEPIQLDDVSKSTNGGTAGGAQLGAVVAETDGVDNPAYRMRGDAVNSPPMLQSAPAPGLPAPSSLAIADYEMKPQPPQGGDSFANLPDNPMQTVVSAPVSTFSADVDTASYSTVRRMLRGGQLPPVDAVRTEEMVNYFNYNYALPERRSQPFAPTVAVYPNPWHEGTELLHIGIKAFDLPEGTRPPVNLVLLIDVSGSMDEPTKLPLVKSSFAMLLEQLKPTDTVSIVTYAGNSGVALPPTKVSERQHILDVVQSLGAGGSTAGAEGLRTAYELAKQNYNKEGVNRILLATDGDFNVGVSEPGGLAEYVAKQRSSGIFLSVLGYGMGNYQDSTMQALAQNGNGTAAYIDDMSEARRVLSDEVSKTLFTVAKDVKFQVEFNPAQVQSYRLLGYETRALRQQDFNNDKVDAGEVGAGSEVTAIYEIVPAGAVPATDGSRYQPAPVEALSSRLQSAEIGHLRIRYKLPDSDTSTLIERPVTNGDKAELGAAPADIRFGAAVAGFSRLLRHSEGMGSFGYQDVIKLAESARGDDRDGERIQFIDLVRTAQSLAGSQPVPAEDGGVAFPPPPSK